MVIELILFQGGGGGGYSHEMIRQNPNFIRVQLGASYDWPDSRVLLNTKKKSEKRQKQRVFAGLVKKIVYGKPLPLVCFERGHSKIVKLLLKHGARCDIQDAEGNTAL